MDKAFEMLHDASIFWRDAGDAADANVAVVAFVGYHRMISESGAAMVSGLCQPMIYPSLEKAQEAAEDLHYSMSDLGDLVAVNYREFCHKQTMRFSEAYRALRVAHAKANDEARQNAVAA